MKKKKYLKKVGVPMKKRVVGRRVLSFLLCMMMVFCTVPLIASAAADGAGITVLERSAPKEVSIWRGYALQLLGG